MSSKLKRKKEHCKNFVEFLPLKAKQNAIAVSLLLVFVHTWFLPSVPMESINGFVSPPQFIPNADYGLEKREIEKISFWVEFNPYS